MSYKQHAEIELQAAGYDLNDTEEGPNKWIMENIFELLDVFEKQGHSGSSAQYCISMFKKLASFEPLGPLTGDDSEWTKVSDNMWQNKRCSRVFKEADGKAYDIEGKIFREPSGGCYTGKDSIVYITFPYYPVSEYIDLDHDGNPTREGKYGIDLIADEIDRRQQAGQLTDTENPHSWLISLQEFES